MALYRGKYPENYSFWKLMGENVNTTQAGLAVRSNAEFVGMAGLADTAAALTSQVCTSVAVPVEIDDTISKVTVLVGATPAGTPTNSWVALYSGTAALLSQSTDITTTAIGASAAFTFTLATPQFIYPGYAPSGYVYVSIMSKATVVPSLATVSVAPAVGYKWFAGGPLFLAATHGSALTTTAPLSIVSPIAQAATPIVILS